MQTAGCPGSRFWNPGFHPQFPSTSAFQDEDFRAGRFDMEQFLAK